MVLTEDMTPGVVALPHGWGHQGGWQLANAAGGVNSNVLASAAPESLERLAGMAHLNGIAVEVEEAKCGRWERSRDMPREQFVPHRVANSSGVRICRRPPSGTFPCRCPRRRSRRTRPMTRRFGLSRGTPGRCSSIGTSRPPRKRPLLSDPHAHHAAEPQHARGREGVVAREVAERVRDRLTAVALDAAQHVRAGAEDGVGARVDHRAGEAAGLAAVLAERRLAPVGHVRRARSFGARVDEDDHHIALGGRRDLLARCAVAGAVLADLPDVPGRCPAAARPTRTARIRGRPTRTPFAFITRTVPRRPVRAMPASLQPRTASATARWSRSRASGCWPGSGARSRPDGRRSRTTQAPGRQSSSTAPPPHLLGPPRPSVRSRLPVMRSAASYERTGAKKPRCGSRGSPCLRENDMSPTQLTVTAWAPAVAGTGTGAAERRDSSRDDPPHSSTSSAAVRSVSRRRRSASW